MDRKQAHDYLQSNTQFSELPRPLRDWILESPNATGDFADFFDKGGTFDASQRVGMPYYLPHDPPKIMVDKSTWNLIHQPNSEFMQRDLFGSLAHEIGHDRYNTAITKFPGGPQEDYIHYRAELEAQAIFNSFSIFKDLQGRPEFERSFPFDSIGYLNGFELGQYYKDWTAGRMDDFSVVSQLAKKVPDVTYGLSSPLADQNNDGLLTHRDLYIHDYLELIRKQPGMAISPNSSQAKELDSLDQLISAFSKSDNIELRSLREAYFQSDDGQQLMAEAAKYGRARQVDAYEYTRSRGLGPSMDGSSFGTLTGRRDPRDWDHPDHELYSAIRRELPPRVSDEAAAHVMLQAKQAGIVEPRDLDGVEVRNDRAFVVGKQMQAAHADLSQDPPPMRETVRQSELLDQRMEQERAQWLAQQQELARSGPSISR